MTFRRYFWLFLEMSLLICGMAHAHRWKERQEFPIAKGKIEARLKGSVNYNYSITNEYGDLEIVITRDPSDGILVTGDYSSEHLNPATVQYLIDYQGNENLIFIDGPALFKSHDHVAKYGKRIDYDFLRAQVGQLDGFTLDGDTVHIGTAASIQPNRVQIHERSAFWNAMTLGRNVSWDEGATVGKLPASAKMIVRIPLHLIGELELKAKKGGIVDVRFEGSQPANYAIEPKAEEPHQVKVFRTDRPCATDVGKNK